MKLAIILLALLGLACAAPVRERRSDLQTVAELERALSSLLADKQAKQNPPPNRVDGGTGGPGTPGTGDFEGLLFSLLAANQDGDTGDPSTTGLGGERADAEGLNKIFSKVKSGIKNGIKKGAILIHKGVELYDKYGHLIPVCTIEKEEEDENENENLMPLLSLLLSAQQDNGDNNNNRLLALLQDDSLPGDYEAPLNSMELADAEGWKKTFSKWKNGIKKGAKLIHKGAELYDKYGHLVPAMQEEELLTYLLASK